MGMLRHVLFLSAGQAMGDHWRGVPERTRSERWKSLKRALGLWLLLAVGSAVSLLVFLKL